MTVVLRDYQVEAVMTWFKHNRKGIIELPTGTGKTYIAMKVMEYYYSHGKNILVVVPTEVLMNQWREKIIKHTNIPRYDIGLLYAKEKRFKRVTIAIINTAVKYIDVIKEKYDLIILDEVHHYFAPRWSVIIDALYETKDILGLSATVERVDKRHLGSKLKVIYSKSYSYMEKNGYVAPIKVEILRAPLSLEERMVYNKLEDKIRKVSLDLERCKEWGLERNVEVLEQQLMILVNKRKQLCSEALYKLPLVLQIIRKELSREPDSRIIVFTESIRTVVRMKQYLESHGIKCGVVHSKVKNRKLVLDMWKRGAFKVLLTVRVLDEGVDVPEANVGIIVSNSLTRRQLVQRIGRTVRPREGKEARIYIVIASGTFEEKLARLIRRAIYEAYH